jgi:hypothetical protein
LLTLSASRYRRQAELAQHASAGEDISPAFVMAEEQADFRPRTRLRRAHLAIFGLARDTIFEAFATSDDVVDLVSRSGK